MPIKRFELLDLRPPHICRGCLGVVGLLVILIFISCVNDAAQSDQVVAHDMKAFFEAWLGRGLRGDELRKVTDDFIAFHTRRGKNQAGIHEYVKIFLEHAKFLREREGTPGAFMRRHFLLELNYFEPDLQNTTTLRLLTEPDPVCVVDAGEKHLLTEKDAVALANLSYFLNSNKEPHHRDLSRQEVDNLVVKLDRFFSNRPKVNRVPRYYREMAALWAGIQREWPQLTDVQKRQVLTYVAKGNEAPMDDYLLYGRLLDLNAGDAFSHWSNDSTMGYLSVMKDYASTMAIINSIGPIN